MGLQLVVLAKVNSIVSSHNLTPLLAGLIWPFLAKLSFSSRLVRETYTDLVRASGLFFFRLRQIALEAEQPSTAAGTSSGNGGTGGSRWERALLLVYRGMARTRRSMTTTAVEDEDSLHALSMLAL